MDADQVRGRSILVPQSSQAGNMWVLSQRTQDPFFPDGTIETKLKQTASYAGSEQVDRLVTCAEQSTL